MNRSGQGMQRAAAGIDVPSANPIMSSSLDLQGSGNWQVWGIDPASPTASAFTSADNVDNDSTNKAPILALPHFFPEKGTVTAFAMVLEADTSGFDQFWVGCARTKYVSSNPYPDVTLPGSFAAVQGGGTASRRLRGFSLGTPVTVAQSGPEWLWAIWTSPGGSAVHGTQLQKITKQFCRQALGVAPSSLVGLALGAATPAITYPLNGGGAVGYEATWQATGAGAFNDPVAYNAAGMNFPAGMPLCRTAELSNANSGFVLIPAIYYLWTRG